MFHPTAIHALKASRLNKACEEAHARAHEAEDLLAQAERRIAIWERTGSAGFEWEGQVNIGTDPLLPIPMRIRSTESGIRGAEETIWRLHARVAELEAVERQVRGDLVWTNGATIYAVSCGDATMTVTGSRLASRTS